MADYKLTIHFIGGEGITVMARNQVDNIEEFTRRMSNMNAGYFTRISEISSAMVNTNNITYIEIEKE